MAKSPPQPKVGRIYRDKDGYVTALSRYPFECEIQSIQVKVEGQGAAGRLTCEALRMSEKKVHTVWGMGHKDGEILKWAIAVGCTAVDLPGFYGKPGIIAYKKTVTFLLVGEEKGLKEQCEGKLCPVEIFDPQRSLGDQIERVHCILRTDTSIEVGNTVPVCDYSEEKITVTQKTGQWEMMKEGDWVTELAKKICDTEGW